jgi:1-acyl-sn-glycerol-3-phosphate acyltransferase
MERVFWTMRFSHACLLILLQITGSTYAFTTPAIQRAVGLFDRATNSVVRVSTSSAIRPNGESSPPPAKVLNKKERKELIRKEGGWLSFQTPFGGLNPFGIYYGLTSILLGIPWFFALCLCQLLYFVTGNRVDKQRAIPTFLSHIWGLSLMTLTRCWPKIKNKEILDNFYKNGGAAMIVANHNSWMDIPFVGGAIGWRNYKLVSKKELGKVPILGKSIKVGNHIMVDRSDSKSGLRTLKQGIKYLKVSSVSFFTCARLVVVSINNG